MRPTVNIECHFLEVALNCGVDSIEFLGSRNFLNDASDLFLHLNHVPFSLN